MPNAGGSAVSLNRGAPVLDYTSADFLSLVEDMKAWAQSKWSDRWTDFNPSQFAVVLLELVGYNGDLLTFYLNAGLRETFLSMAQRRANVVRIAESLGYQLRSSSQASASLTVVSNGGALPYAMPAATTKFASGDITWQPDQDYTITATPQTISVLEGERFAGVSLGSGTGLRGQTKALAHTPIVDSTLVVSVNGTPWERVLTFTLANPDDEYYRVLTDDDGLVTVLFGDNVNGKAPSAGLAITASYTVGGGTQGRVALNTITQLVSVPVGTLSVTNPAASTGGNPEETIEQARSAVPASFQAGDRCVSLEDYASKSLAATASVAKAVAQQYDSRTVALTIAPAGGGQPTDVLKNTVAAYLSSRRMIGHSIVMRNPTYVPVLITVDLFVRASAIGPDVRRAAQELFITTNANADQNGLVDFDNVGFGARDANGVPQLTRDGLDLLLRTHLEPVGVQRARVIRFTTTPPLKPLGYVNSGDAALAFTRNEADELVRRQFLITFTSGTTYNVHEGIVGTSTQLTRTVLTDDRALFPSLASVVAELNPNTNQSTYLAVNEVGSTGQALLLANAADDLFAYALTGAPYRLQWPSSPATGTVGVAYTPTKQDGTGDPHGFSWTVSGTGFGVGDRYTIDVFAYADDCLLLNDDEVPTLALADLTINLRSAH
jgi:hypothetical protein